MTNEKRCLLAGSCKLAGDPDRSNSLCYPFLKMHGESVTGGIMGLAEIPPMYTRMTLSSLPILQDNPAAYELIAAYVGNILDNVGQGTGFYFYSIPNKDNPKGTRTGKTTATASILNEYVIAPAIPGPAHPPGTQWSNPPDTSAPPPDRSYWRTSDGPALPGCLRSSAARLVPLRFLPGPSLLHSRNR